MYVKQKNTFRSTTGPFDADAVVVVDVDAVDVVDDDAVVAADVVDGVVDDFVVKKKCIPCKRALA